jgi:hypothetical protein
MYEGDIEGGRPSIAPEKLLRAMLCRWFMGLAMDDSVWVPTVFSKNRERWTKHDAVVALFNKGLKQADQKKGCP